MPDTDAVEFVGICWLLGRRTVATLGNNFREQNVATSRDDKYSLFRLYRRLINLRRSHIALTEGTYRPVAPDGDLLLFFREWRDDRLLIALNMGCQPSAISFAGQRLSGFVLLSTFADREGEAVADTVDLRGNEGAGGDN